MKRVWRRSPSHSSNSSPASPGYAVGILWPHGAYKAERIVRGQFWARRLSGRDLWIGRHVQFEGERITLGSRVRLYDGSHFVTGRRGWITIGDDTHISRMSIVSGLGGVTIGCGCAISATWRLSVTADTAADEVAVADRVKSPVVIGDNVYIGAGAKVIPGVRIGNDVVVAAGAIVTRDIPPGMLAKGVPATHSPLTRRMTRPGSGRGPAQGRK